ncbi:bifunctional biotin--[acetyl-CoA-carboxylase] ligase/biotin operon repressor BirA [Gilvimarinus agarilyticus]|uniref:bifunctional biotin--[acetyl-CoA-carboxylase] ligase/biotin operon repressor BirA n=1 Tax=Gilvimarinus agarilyticus TaxID=679259 RepID=UPI0005A10791|nr:bifunctional biotin--[acetyl-CoA-carboxylase] ligase/biotin operon repressor BirA [Gilvimarinus agarilyticus]
MQQDQLQSLLAVLADGEYHSGSELGELLGVSRAAVWKHLQKLSELGIELDSSRGRGYCLPGGLELLSESKIAACMSANAALLSLEVLPLVDSTNTRLMSRAEQLPSGVVCIAEQQSAGRGRRGRAWVSPFARNLYFSMLWRFDGGAAELEGLSLAVGVCIAEALESLGVVGVSLKWPNDVLADGKKLAGILLEMSGDPAGACHLVIGVGINVDMAAAQALDIDQPWVDVASLARAQGLAPISRNVLCARVLSNLCDLLSEYPEYGFARWRERWMARAAHLNKPVRLTTASQQIQGVLVGVDVSGALKLATDAGEQLVYGGEVSLRSES